MILTIQQIIDWVEQALVLAAIERRNREMGWRSWR